MGLELIDTAVRRIHRGLYFRTLWGWILFILAIIVFIFGSDEKRHGDDFETAERRTRANNISRTVATVLFILAIVVDIFARD